MNSGSWSAVLPWPFIGIHLALLPNGDVFSFGSSQLGDQGQYKMYDIWDPGTGLHVTTNDVLPTDEFCSAEVIDPITNNILIVGGDARPLGRVNFGVTDVNTYSYQS